VNYERVFTGYGGFAALRDKRWHYFRSFRGSDAGKGPALYDLQADPEERTNVLEHHPNIAAEFVDMLSEKFDATLTPPKAS
jgi:arylsulfatase A-like enzyme